ncbi:MAG TPA: hypothetical protein VIL45_07075 [Thermoplasmata archaeon]
MSTKIRFRVGPAKVLSDRPFTANPFADPAFLATYAKARKAKKAGGIMGAIRKGFAS